MPATIHVVVCAGTACHVMGGSNLFLIEEKLSPATRARVELEGKPCLDMCKEHERGPAGGGPFASVDGVVIAGADIASLAAAIEARAAELGD